MQISQMKQLFRFQRGSCNGIIWVSREMILFKMVLVHYLIGAVFGILSREISVLYVSELIWLAKYRIDIAMF